MKVLATRSGSILSKIIRWICQEPASHICFSFDDVFLIQSNLIGVGMDYFSNFKHSQEIVGCIDFPLPLEIEDAVWRECMARAGEAGYDFKGGIYAGWRIFLNRHFGIKRPALNKWQSDDEFLCLGLLSVFDGIIKEMIGKSLNIPDGVEMLTPMECMALLREAKKGWNE